MKMKSIFKQMLIPMVTIVSLLAIILIIIITVFFVSFHEKEICSRNQDEAELMAGNIGTFVNGAYSVTEELAVNPSILTMDTKTQTAILEDCVARNSYLELLYIQGNDGMQTGRSSGELADRSTRWWFTQVMKEKQAFVSKSYYSVNTGMPCASIFFPMYNAGDMIGIFAADLKLDYLQTMIEEYSDTSSGKTSFVIDGEGVVVAHPDNKQIEEQYNYKTLTKTVSSKDKEGNPVTDADGNIVTEEQSFQVSQDYQHVIEAALAGNSGVEEIQNDGKTYYVSYSPIHLSGESDSWAVIKLQEKSTAMAMVYHVIIIMVLIVLAAITVATVVITILAKKLTKPIVSLNNLVGYASEGDFSIQADESGNNELGTLAKSFNQMTAKISGIFGRITSFAGEVIKSSGCLVNIEEQIGAINESVQKISQGTDKQNQDVERVMMRTGELEEDFAQLKQQSTQLLEEAGQSIEAGKHGAANIHELKKQNETTIRMMEDSYQTIMELEEQSRKISTIVSTINEISSQTGLLSLNASIEAARAGEQGRGFAVVAESIGKLASDSSTATADIEQIIQDLCIDINNTVKNIQKMKENIMNQTAAVDVVSRTFGEFDEMNHKTTISVQSIEEMVTEMHKSNRSIVHAISRISDISKNTAELAEKSSESLQQQYGGISEVAERVRNLSMISAEIEKEMSRFKM